MRLRTFCFLGILACAGAQASTITIIETAAANGSLDGTPFSNAVVTITFTGNTNNIFTSGMDTLLNGTATVSVAGGGSDTFTDTIQAYAVDTFGTAGLEDIGSGSVVILETDSSAFDTYGLNTSIGPIVGTPFLSGSTFPTAGGTFRISSIHTMNDTTSVSFTANVSGVPEPGSLSMIGLGIAAVGWRKLRRPLVAQKSL